MPDDPTPARTTLAGQLWSDIPGHEGLYQINEMGEVRSLERWVRIGGHHRKVGGHNLAQPLDLHGRPIVGLLLNGSQKTWRVHVLVAMVFLGPKPKGYHIHHTNGDMTDNRVANLVYINGVEHQRLHKKGKPGSVRGIQHGQAKLNPEIVLNARQRHKDGESIASLARESHVCDEVMSRAIKGITWGHV